VTGQRVFLHDCEAEKAKNAQAANDEAFKQRFFLWWKDTHRSSDDPVWNEFKAEFRKRGITFAKYPMSYLDYSMLSIRLVKAV